MSGLTGTLNIILDDGESETTIVSLRNCTISFELEMFERIDPNVYGWKAYVPGNHDWSAAASHVELLTAGETAAYLKTLETLAFNKTVVSVEFSTDAVDLYTGTAFIDTWQIGGAENDLFAGQFSLKGVASLEQFDRALIFMVSDTDFFYRQAGSFAPEVNTGLDLSALSIIDIDRHQVSGTIYGLTDGGDVYTWRSDGSNLQFVFSSGFTDFTRIHVDSRNNELLLSAHTAGLFNERFYIYSLSGTALRNFEQRSGTNSITQAIEDIGYVSGEMFAFDWEDLNLYRLSMVDGDDDFLQTISSTIEHRGGVIVDVADVAYHSLSNNMTQWNPATINNPTDASFIGAIPLGNSDRLDWFDYDGERIIIGHNDGGTMPLLSYSLTTNTTTESRTTINVKASCTKHDFDND